MGGCLFLTLPDSKDWGRWDGKWGLGIPYHPSLQEQASPLSCRSASFLSYIT